MGIRGPSAAAARGDGVTRRTEVSGIVDLVSTGGFAVGVDAIGALGRTEGETAGAAGVGTTVEDATRVDGGALIGGLLAWKGGKKAGEGSGGVGGVGRRSEREGGGEGGEEKKQQQDGVGKE